MVQSIDVSKFRKNITKSIKGISEGFHDPIYWVSTGNYALDYLISGDFNKGIPLGKVAMFAGQSGSGKSFVCSGNLARNAQKEGALVVLIDTENALDNSWLEALGVDTSPDKLIKFGASMVDDVAGIISNFMEGYKDDFGHLDYKEQPKVMIIVDSLGMLLTPTDQDQFKKGDMKGDFGRKAKALNALVRNTVNLIAPHPVALVGTNHTYESQDMFDPDDKITGGQVFIYASSIVVAMKKLKLKEDDAGRKVSDVLGIKAVFKVMKTRYAKPFESVKVNIPYSTGMDPISGLFDLFLATGKLEKVGNRYKYVTLDGREIVEFRKDWDLEKFKIIMDEFSQDDLKVVNDVSDVEEEDMEEMTANAAVS